MSLDIVRLERAATALKHLIREQRGYIAKSEKARTAAASSKQMQKLSTDLHYQGMSVKQAQRDAWAAILDADMAISTGAMVVNPTGWQEFRIAPTGELKQAAVSPNTNHNEGTAS